MRAADYRPLTEPVDWATVRRETTGASSISIGEVLGLVAGLAVLAVFALIVPAIVASLAGSTLAVITTVAIIAAAIGLVALTIRRAVTSRTRLWRMLAFARANGMSYWRNAAQPPYTGTIFSVASGSVTELFRQHTGHEVEYGNYQYTTGSGKSRTTHFWGYVSIPLDRRLPHMMLDARGNNSIFGSNLPITFDRDQVLSLEGDFDDYFTLYCPAGYETDALYVFTPDLMALLIDHAAAFDVEVIDDRVFVYRTGSFDFGDAPLWARLFLTVDTVGAKALHQTHRYADDRVGVPAGNIVAPQGRRLQRGASVASIVAIVAVVAIWLASIWWR